MFQLILNPIRDWNAVKIGGPTQTNQVFQLILNPIRDWNSFPDQPKTFPSLSFQLILNPIRDWNWENTLNYFSSPSSN